jgi:IclR family acetate operon transcriptional repressor
MSASDATTARQAPKYPIGSVDNALRLLTALGSRPAVRLSDVATELDVASSTAHRLLSQMEFGGFVLQDEVSRLYRAGPALIQLAQKLSPPESSGYAAPVMQELARRLGATVNLLLLQGTNVLFLDSIEAPRAVRVTSRAGVVLPAHCVSGGKALLSMLSEDEVLRLYPSPELPKVTEKSITERRVLLSQLKKARRLGFATNFGESEPDVSGVAVVIPATSDHSPRALAVAMPKGRLPGRQVMKIVEAMQESTSLLAEELAISASGRALPTSGTGPSQSSPRTTEG